MNNLLFQMIAARAAGGANPAMADMLARICASSGTNAVQNPQELLAQLSANNPLLSALRNQLAEARTNGSELQPSPVIDVEPEEECPRPVAQLRKAPQEDTSALLHDLREQVQSLLTETKLLRDRCDLLASTLGACCLCWGQDPECRACRGRGRPGYAMPDEAQFYEFVLPAIRMLRAQRAKLGGVSVAQQRKPAVSSALVSDNPNQNERTSPCQ